MENPGAEIAYPTAEQICEVNRRMIGVFGGGFVPPVNLRNPDALEYALDAISASIYGSEIYGTLKEKAAALAYYIISRHVFFDGNKRTAAHVAWAFLRSNGIRLFLDQSIIELTESAAGGDANYNDFLEWLHNHQ